MMRPGFAPDGSQETWDPTSLASFMKCPRRYQYEIHDGWHLPPGEGGDYHLIFGKLLHGAWEIIKRELGNSASRDDALITGLRWVLREAWAEGVVWRCQSCEAVLADSETGAQPFFEGECPHCLVPLSETPPIGAPWGHYWESGDKYKNFPFLLRTIIWGFEDLSRVYETAVVGGELMVEVGVERPFTTSTGVTYTLRAKLDEVVTDGLAQWVVEKKTTKTTLSPAYFRRFSPNVQITHQAWLAKTSGQIPQALGVMVEAHQVAIGFSRFSREHVKISAERITEWEKTLDFWLRLAYDCHLQGYYGMNEAACNLDGGCPFRRVCETPASLRPGFLAANYIRQVWDPTKGEVVGESE